MLFPVAVEAELTLETAYTNVSGNSNSQVLVGGVKFVKEGDIHYYDLSGNAYYSATDDIEKYTAKYEHFRYYSERWYRAEEVGAYRFPDSGYDYRIFGGAGAGYYISRGDAVHVRNTLYAQYYSDRYVTTGKDEYWALKDIVEVGFRVSKTAESTIKIGYVVSLENTDRYFAYSSVSVKTGISERLSLAVSYDIHYQNIPPPGGFKRTDSMLITKFVISVM